ncbi:MAG: hypothetical protein J6M47_02195 [Clostridia bacterium]|nr:hypothetical protein [Clostridia bacterium]
MDRRKRRNPVVTGVNHTYGGYGLDGGKKKKKKGVSGRFRAILAAAALVVFVLVVLGYTLSGSGRSDVGRVTRVGATLSQNVVPFGDSVVFYDGTTLYCVSPSGSNLWSYQIGLNADYDATDEHIVAWSGNDIYMLGSRGNLIFNDNLSDSIQFASAGEDYVAAFIGDPDNGVISVFNDEGQIVDNITVENQTMLNMGFFKSPTTSSTQETEMLWALGLDTSGTVISTELQTFQPGKLATGKSSLGENIAYAVYFADGILNVVDTRQIAHYNYRIIEQQNPTLIYGYTLERVKEYRGTTYQLLIPAQEQDEGVRINNVRLIYGNQDRVLHLPGECLAVELGTRSVYGFSSGAVYVCRYGETMFKSYALPVNVTSVLGMISDNRAVVTSGSDVYVIELPT